MKEITLNKAIQAVQILDQIKDLIQSLNGKKERKVKEKKEKPADSAYGAEEGGTTTIRTAVPLEIKKRGRPRKDKLFPVREE